MKIKAWFALIKVSIEDFLHFRIGIFVMLLGNCIYLTVIYNLWKAIYASVDGAVINGMGFNDTMIYLVLASAQFTFMETYLVWEIGRSIQSGKIVLDLLKPLPFEQLQFFSVIGANFCTFLTTFIPTFFIIQFITDFAIPMGINLVFYLISAFIGSLINFVIDFFVGTICLHTQSIWGVNIMKEVVVLFFSGATVPLAFFPQGLKNVAMFLPFHSIYDTPLNFLAGNAMSVSESLLAILEQLIWLVVMFIIAKVFFKLSERVITVNGG